MGSLYQCFRCWKEKGHLLCILSRNLVWLGKKYSSFKESFSGKLAPLESVRVFSRKVYQCDLTWKKWWLLIETIESAGIKNRMSRDYIWWFLIESQSYFKIGLIVLVCSHFRNKARMRLSNISNYHCLNEHTNMHQTLVSFLIMLCF